MTSHVDTRPDAGQPRKPASHWQPRTLALGLARGRIELLQYVRSKESLMFSIAFPVLMLAMFGAVVAYDTVDGVPFADYFTPCMLAAGIFASGFQSLAIQIAMEREKGVHRRLATTPLPLASYLIGKIILVGFLAIVTSTLLLAVAVIGYGVSLPSSLSAWLTILGVGALGLVACTLLGITFSSLPRTARAAPAVITPVALAIQVISGIFLPLSELPDWLYRLSLASPLTWLVEGIRSGFTDTHLHPRDCLIALTIWTILGAITCRQTFRWH